MSINWDKAPAGATHYNEYNLMFYCLVDGVYYFYGDDNIELLVGGPARIYSDDEFTARQQPQPKPWSGPEDGLPPVGTRCKVNPSNAGWREAEISYVGNQFIVWLQIGDEDVPENGGWTEFTKFAPIRTPDQLRETAIRELMDIAQVDCRVTAARLVDAGFKREVV